MQNLLLLLADLPLPREVDPENPITAHESDCHVYYIFNYPMTCGEELVFNSGTLACEPAENVADSRPECASESGSSNYNDLQGVTAP